MFGSTTVTVTNSQMRMRMKMTVVTAAVPKNMFRRWVPMVSREGEFGTNAGGVRKPTAMPIWSPQKQSPCTRVVSH